jgi:hypothetical protein
VAGQQALVDRVIQQPEGPGAITLSPWVGNVEKVCQAAKIPCVLEWARPPSSASVPADAARVELRGRSVRAVLDDLVPVGSPYRWRVVNGVVVVRPSEAWDSPVNPLNRRVAPLAVSGVDPDVALKIIVAAIRGVEPPASDAAGSRWPPLGWTVSLSVAAGSGLDALVALAGADGNMQLTVREPPPSSVRWCLLIVWARMRDVNGAIGECLQAPPK